MCVLGLGVVATKLKTRCLKHKLSGKNVLRISWLKNCGNLLISTMVALKTHLSVVQYGNNMGQTNDFINANCSAREGLTHVNS